MGRLSCLCSSAVARSPWYGAVSSRVAGPGAASAGTRSDGPVTSLIVKSSRRWKRNASSTNLSWVGLIRSGPTFASANLISMV